LHYRLYFVSDYCCEGHIHSSLNERLECIRSLDEFCDYLIANFREY